MHIYILYIIYIYMICKYIGGDGGCINMLLVILILSVFKTVFFSHCLRLVSLHLIIRVGMPRLSFLGGYIGCQSKNSGVFPKMDGL